MTRYMNNHFDEQKWAALSFYEQMGNIGSEVGRAMKALERGDEQSLAGAYFRGLDLIDATVRNISQAGRRKELLRVREQFSQAVEAGVVDKKLSDYFMTFAMLARSQ